MFGITDLTTFLLGAIVIILLPGPNSLYCLSVASQYGIKAGYQAVLGILLGDTVLIVLAVVGVGTLLKIYPALFVALKILGGAYLFYLGIRMLMGGYHNLNAHFKKIPIANQTDNHKNHNNAITNHKKIPYFYKSLLLSLTNPKAILFFLSFFIGFVRPDYDNPALSFTILGVILQMISLAYLSFLVFFGAKLVQRLGDKLWLSGASLGAVGLLFMGFAVNLWRASI